MDEKLTLRMVAEELGVHYMTAYNYVRLGRLTAVRRGRQWQVKRSDLDAFTAASRHTARGMSPTRRIEWPRHRQRLIARLLAAHEPGAWAVSAIGAGADPREVYLELLAPVLEDIGVRISQVQGGG